MTNLLNLADLIRHYLPELTPDSTKAHFAVWNGFENPLEVFRAGRFEDWQNEQTLKNFGRRFVLSLIATPEPDIWLFAGVFESQGEPVWFPKNRPLPSGYSWDTEDGLWIYDLVARSEVEPLIGRAYIRFQKVSRQSYRYLETVAGGLVVVEISREPLGIPAFPGYRKVHLSMPQLRQIMDTAPADWRTALGAVGGVYLITDPEGRHYVGSASGSAGIWGRWSEYARSGHGENRKLRDVVGTDPAAAEGFHFSILETADSLATRDEVVTREGHWKEVLGSRAIGLNLN